MLLLYALGRLQRTETTDVSYLEAEPALAHLLQDFGPPGRKSTPPSGRAECHMLTLAGVEEFLGATLPVPSRLPALWGTVVSSDWQVKPAAKSARLQLVLGGRASNRPGLITIDYEAEERPDVEATAVDPWHLAFYASAQGVTLLCTLNQRCPMNEAVSFMDSVGAEEVRLLSHESWPKRDCSARRQQAGTLLGDLGPDDWRDFREVLRSSE